VLVRKRRAPLDARPAAALSNKVISVTGSSRGIGTAIVKEMLKAGYGEKYTARDPKTLPAFGDAWV
jgi:NADP-dependent 3-hydroxy acid dehydrogenase YdfG